MIWITCEKGAYLNGNHIFTGKSYNPIFIGGLMMSGTSLMRVLLGQHHNLLGGLETHWFDDNVRFGWSNLSSRRMEILMSLFDLSTKELQVFIDAKDQEPQREFIDIVMEYCTRKEGKVRWVEKTPDNLQYWNLICQQWPSPTLIHVTREYKDVYASWKVRRRDSLERFLEKVKQVYGPIKHLLGKETENYLLVDYLELVLNTEQTMKTILNKLGEPWDPACAQISTDKTEDERTKIKKLLGRESHTAVSLSKPIFTSSIGQWRQLITDTEKERIETELAELYKIYGNKWSKNSYTP